MSLYDRVRIEKADVKAFRQLPADGCFARTWQTDAGNVNGFGIQWLWNQSRGKDLALFLTQRRAIGQHFGGDENQQFRLVRCAGFLLK